MKAYCGAFTYQSVVLPVKDKQMELNTRTRQNPQKCNHTPGFQIQDAWTEKKIQCSLSTRKLICMYLLRWVPDLDFSLLAWVHDMACLWNF